MWEVLPERQEKIEDNLDFRKNIVKMFETSVFHAFDLSWLVWLKKKVGLVLG